MYCQTTSQLRSYDLYLLAHDPFHYQPILTIYIQILLHMHCTCPLTDESDSMAAQPQPSRSSHLQAVATEPSTATQIGG